MVKIKHVITRISIRQKCIICILAICIYVIISLFINFYSVNNNLRKIYILKNNVSYGDVLKENDIFEVTLKNSSNTQNLISDISYISDKIISKDLGSGHILELDDFLLKSDYLNVSKDKNMELVTIKIENIDSILLCDLSINSKVNIIYTGKTSLANKTVEKLNSKNVIRNNDFLTIKLLENVNILKIYNENFGKVLDRENNDFEAFYIVCRVNKNMSMIINNLKEYGHFNLSVVR